MKGTSGSQTSLQNNCNREGFRAVVTGSHHSKARIGITNNEQNDCSSCDSRIEFGTGEYPDNSNTCTNLAFMSPDNWVKHIKKPWVTSWCSKMERSKKFYKSVGDWLFNRKE